ncbi:4Fe-4S dicluster domain-containing protein [Dankookia sp. GCM10030260]|uniref:4Fe-4S dicluster domain-containing protein n=1 Tax=Dankookia sp. GCM10030260 TaxID=3273390 RepID=UPI00360FD198
MMDGGLSHDRARGPHGTEACLPLPQEAELTCGTRIEPGRAYGFFTDTTLCIGCKACEVACKEWNNLPADGMTLSGRSYDNTGALGAHTWRHVTFVEKLAPQGERPGAMPPFQSNWLMLSDVCKHCDPAPCMEACPTGALFRTEFDTVVVQQDICNGCGYCVPACPFGVVELAKEDGKAHKCTLCYDRLKGGMEPACAKSCPTDSIQFGEVEELIGRAEARVAQLQELGQDRAYLYGAPGTPGATHGLKRLNAFFLLTERPEVHGLPAAPVRPARRARPSIVSGLATVAGLAVAALFLGVGRR